MVLACTVLTIMLPLIVAAFWWFSETESLFTNARLATSSIRHPIATWQRIAGALINELPVLMLVAGIWQARRCFKLFVAGEFFSGEVVACLRWFAVWATLSAVVGILECTAIATMLTWSYPVGERQFMVALGTDQFILLFVAGMVWLMARVIAQGKALAEENATFI